MYWQERRGRHGISEKKEIEKILYWEDKGEKEGRREKELS